MDQFLQFMLTQFFFQYQVILHTTTELSPAELIKNCRLRSSMDCIKYPDTSQRIELHHKGQVVNCQTGMMVCIFMVASIVFSP